MFKKTVYCIALCLALAAAAAAQIDPKGFLADKALDFSKAHALPFQAPDLTLFENVIVDNQHFAMVAGWKKNKLEPAELYPLTAVQIPRRTINTLADWDGVPPVVTDPAGDVNPAGYPGTDLANVYLARDNANMYFLMTLHDANPRLDTIYVVEFQQYLTQLHTPGDVITMAIYDGGVWKSTVSARGPGMNWYYVATGVVSLGAKKVGWKLPIDKLEYPADTPHPYFPPSPSTRQGIDNRFVRAYIHVQPGLPGPVADSNESLSRPLIVDFYR